MKPCYLHLFTFALAATVLAPLSAQAYYNPSTGRWLSRDPIGESGGKDLYMFVNNAPLAAWDYLGNYVHLAPLNGVVHNASSARITITGDWVEVDMYHGSDGSTYTVYPWSSWDYWKAIHDPPPMDHSIGEREPGGSHTLAPGHTSPGDWQADDTRIVDADFITGSTKPVYDSLLCLFPISLPIKVGPLRLVVHDCDRFHKGCGVYVMVGY